MSDTQTQAPEIFENEFVVTVRGIRYTFKIPSIMMDVEIGYRSRDIRRRADPNGSGDLMGMDNNAVSFAWSCAVLELYLTAADTEWPFQPGPGGKPMVDSSKFPARYMNTVLELGSAFGREVERFREDRAADNNAAGA